MVDLLNKNGIVGIIGLSSNFGGESLAAKKWGRRNLGKQTIKNSKKLSQESSLFRHLLHTESVDRLEQKGKKAWEERKTNAGVNCGRLIIRRGKGNGSGALPCRKEDGWLFVGKRGKEISASKKTQGRGENQVRKRVLGRGVSCTRGGWGEKTSTRDFEGGR